MSSDRPGSAIHVVAGAVIDAEDRVLIAQRPPGKHLAGGWEFPGGKLRLGEDRRVGLTRELREEIGIEISTPRPLLRLRHTYAFGQVSLDVWVVRHYLGEPQALDGQALRWCTMSELESTVLLPADKPVVAALRLPERLTQASTSHYTVADARFELPMAGCAGSFARASARPSKLLHKVRTSWCCAARPHMARFLRCALQFPSPYMSEGWRLRTHGRSEPAESARLPIEFARRFRAANSHRKTA